MLEDCIANITCMQDCGLHVKMDLYMYVHACLCVHPCMFGMYVHVQICVISLWICTKKYHFN